MSNVTQVTKEMVINSQVRFGYEHHFVYDISDIGRWVGWDECGFEIAVADTKLLAETHVTMYWWHYLNGGDPRPGQLPRFTDVEQLRYIAPKCVASQVVEYQDSRDPYATGYTLVQLQDDGTWANMTPAEIDIYCNDPEGAIKRWEAQQARNREGDEYYPAETDVS